MKRFKYMALAALVAFAACDEGTDVIVTPDITGDIAGVVTIEGAAVSGVTVTLSSGATQTTDGAGAYSFKGVAAGAYTIAITGFAADATFSSTSKAATIVTAGQVATVNFDGAYVRTAAILGNVAAGGKGLSGVSVSIGSSTTQTDANGQYAFSGLRAGTYTLTVSGYNASQYAFATSTKNVTVGVGESKVVSFDGQLLATSTISGTLYVDGNGNLTKDVGEPAIMKAGITVALERAVGDTIYAMTDANGMYSFASLEEGTFKVILLPQAAIPGAFTQTGDIRYLAVATSGATTTVNFAFIITTQYVKVGAFLGKDADVATPAGVAARVAPAAGVTISLYDTQINAAAGGATGKIGANAVTGADGYVTFKFLRSADRSPLSSTSDNIVFARFVAVAPGAQNQAANGETVIEIPFSSTDTITSGGDEFDVLNQTLVLRFDAKDPSGSLLKGWNIAEYQNDTSAAAVANATGTTHATTGVGRFTATAGVGSLPDTFFVRLSGSQALANGHAWSTMPVGMAPGTAAGSTLRIIHNGTTADSVWLGTINITYKDQDVIARVHHELDDSMTAPTLTGGDDFTNVDNVQVQLYKINTDGTKTSAGVFAATALTGYVTFANVPIGNYEVRARSLVGNQVVLNDTAHAVTLAGAAQVDTVKPLMGKAGTNSTFAYKYNNTSLTGIVRAADGTDANGLKVKISWGPMNVQGTYWGTAKDMMDTTLVVTGGSYSLGGLLEGGYTAMLMEGDSSTVWSAQTFTGSNNTDAYTGSRDMAGPGDNDIINFRARRMDTQVKGTIINDRDADGNVIDPDEALAGAVLELYKDGTGASFGRSADSLVATATTDGNGAYTFSGLPENRYMVRWQGGTPASPALDVLRALSTDSVIVTTAATTVGSGANLTRVVGTAAPTTLPQWDYNASAGVGVLADPTHFMFLYKNTVAKGTVKTGAAAAIAGMTISIRRCNVSAGAVSPPSGAVQTCTSYLGTTINVVSDATGAFSFNALTEGVYEVRPQPTTVAGWNTSAPSSNLFILKGNGDIESYDYIIS